MEFDGAGLLVVRRVLGIVGVTVPPCLQLPDQVAAIGVGRVELVGDAEILRHRRRSTGDSGREKGRDSKGD